MYYVAQGENSAHVVICGELRTTSVGEFLEELFHEDHNRDGLHCVILQPGKVFVRSSTFFFLNVELSPYFFPNLKLACAFQRMPFFVFSDIYKTFVGTACLFICASNTYCVLNNASA